MATRIKQDDMVALSFRMREAADKTFLNNIKEVISAGADMVITRAQTHYLTGGALNVGTGHLRRNVRRWPSRGVKKTGDRFYGVTVGTRVQYGKAWEEGFDVPAMVIEPKEKRALRFLTSDGVEIIRRRVFRPAYSVDARPWLMPSIKDTIPKIKSLLSLVGYRVLTRKGAKG